MKKSDLLMTNQKFEYTFEKYKLLCKTGNYCTFGTEQQSNNFHAHSAYELCLVFKDTGSFIYNDKSFIINPKDLLISDPYTHHEIIANSYSELLLFYLFIDIKCLLPHVAPVCTEDKIIKHFLDQHTCVTHQSDKAFSYYDFIGLHTQWANGFDYNLYQLFKLFLLECLLAFTTKPLSDHTSTIPSSTLEKAQDYIDLHLHQKIYIDEIANFCSVSTRSLQYLFKKELELSIIGYINQQKIKLACHYLMNHFSIMDTVQLIGMNDLSHFNRLFKEITGFTPTQVKKLSTTASSFGRRI